jgi:hypothetical protein
LIIQYIHKANLERRTVFNFYSKILENTVGKLFDNFQNMSTPQFGDLSFSRIIFDGRTLNEIASSLHTVLADVVVHQGEWITKLAAASTATYASYEIFKNKSSRAQLPKDQDTKITESNIKLRCSEILNH